ncbi:hypothetical protein EDB83DRAFT_2582923 [Lactarius deliciosus]|nr:hypothetical protein EDB83DRAFT_2582923 [Lactarius deliciosus]
MTTSSAQPTQYKETEGKGLLMAYVLVPPLCPARASQTICRLSNGLAHASARWQPRGKRGRGTTRARRNSCTCRKFYLRTTHPELAARARDLVGRRRRRRQKGRWSWWNDEDEEEEEWDKFKIPMPPDQALAAAFTHNPTNPNVTALASALAATATRRSAKETRADAQVIARAWRLSSHCRRTGLVRRPCRRVERADAIHTRRTVYAENDNAWPPTGDPVRTCTHGDRDPPALHSSPDPPHPVRKLRETQHGACTTITNSASPTNPDDLHDASLDLDLEAGPTDPDADAYGSRTTSCPLSTAARGSTRPPTRLSSTFLQGNKARIVSISQPTASPAATTTTTTPATITASPIPEPAQKQQQQRKDTDMSGATGKEKEKGREGKTACRGKRIRLFVGSLEPLLVARRRRRSASLTPLDDDDDGDEDGNLDEGGDADATDRGIWPGYVVPVPSAQEMARITPEEVERALALRSSLAPRPSVVIDIDGH